MKQRVIKPEFFENPELGALPPLARLLFIGFWCMADREGRLKFLPPLIKAKLFPYENISENKLEELIFALQEAEVIHIYQVDASRFIEVVNFSKYQNPHPGEKASKLPPRQEKELPPIDVQTLQLNPIKFNEKKLNEIKRCSTTNININSNSNFNSNINSKSTTKKSGISTKKEYLSNEQLKLKPDEDRVVLLTIEDLRALREKIPKAELGDLIQRLHDYLLQSGKKYKNHRAVIRNWHRRAHDGERRQPTHDAPRSD